MILKYNNKVVSYDNKWVQRGGSVPPPDPQPELFGYWIHKTTGVKTEFTMSDSSIIGTLLTSPLWKNDASEISIPEGVITINANAFANSPDLKILVIPGTVTTIGNNILSTCPSFKKLYVYSDTAPSLTSLGTGAGTYDLQIKVKASSYDSYRLASGWSQYNNKLFVLNDLIPGSRVHSGYTVRTTPMTVGGQNNLIIENICFDSDNYLRDISLRIWSSQNIIIRNCKFRGKSVRRAIHIESCSNISIYNCVFENVAMGIGVSQSSGGIRVFSNDFINIRSSFDGAFTFGNVCQITYSTGADYRVQDNVYDGEKGEASCEDVFNLYSCAFSDNNPMINRNNWIRGGGPGDTSGGALIGDDDGTVHSKRAIIEDVIMVEPGQYGISIAGGDYGTLRNNKVYSPRRPWTNVGLIGVNWSGSNSVGTTIENNQIKWTNRNNQNSPYWVHSSIEPIEGWLTNNFNAPIDETILPPKITVMFPGEKDQTVKGWWENSSFGKELVSMDSSYISGGIMSKPSWFNSAIRVVVPPGVVNLDGTFDGASMLKSIKLPNTLVTIANNAFNGTNLDELNIPSSVTFVGNNNLNAKKLIFNSQNPPSIGSTQDMSNVQIIEVPDGRVSVYSSVFSAFGKSGVVRQRNYDNGYWISTGNVTSTITLDHDLVWGKIMVSPDPNSKVVKELKVPGGIEHLISNFMLDQTNLQKVILPDTLKSIGQSAFRNCSSLTEINIPHGVLTLSQVVFQGCSSLRNITIPSTVTFISSNAFGGNGQMTMRFLNPVPADTDGSLNFLTTLTGKSIKVPAASVNAYKAAPVWSNYASIITADV